VKRDFVGWCRLEKSLDTVKEVLPTMLARVRSRSDLSHHEASE